MNITLYEKLSLRAIDRWERQRHQGLDRRILDLASWPVDSVLNAVGQERLATLEHIVHRGVKRLLHTSNLSLSFERLIARARAHGLVIHDISDLQHCSMQLLDRCNRQHIRFHSRGALLMGAFSGLGGPLIATADLTALMLANFHLVQEIAFCYGYAPDDPREKQIMLWILLAGVGGSEMKSKALGEIAALEHRTAGPNAYAKSPANLSVIGSRALAQYVESLSKALLLRLVPRVLPVISVLLAAHANHEMAQQVSQTGFNVYRKRFIRRKQGL